MKLIGETVIPDPQHRDKKPEDESFLQRNKKKLGLALAGIGLAATGGFVAKTTMGGEATPAPEREPSVSAPANPGEAEPASQTTDYGISSAEFASNPELLVNEYADQLNQYSIAGVDEEVASADRKYELTTEEYIAELSAPIDQEFVENLFIEGWENDPELASYVDSVTYVANTTRQVRLLTFSGGTDNVEPYVREMVVDEVDSSNDPLTTSVSWHEQDNRDMNQAGELMGDINPNNIYGGNTFTWTDVDGQLKISGVSNYSG